MPSKKLLPISLLVAISLLLLFPSSVKAWQYGSSMQPTTSQYDSIEMPTQGMYGSTNQVVVCFWESSTTTDGVFVQNGYVYNGLDTSYKLSYGTISIPPHSWGMFWTYYKSGVGYQGDFVLPPSGWQASHRIYYSIAVYPSSGYVSFMFTNSNTGTAVLVKAAPPVSGKLLGNVGSIAEPIAWTAGTDFDKIYVDRIALWAQVISTGIRNCGPAYVYDSSSPSSVLIYVYAPNIVKLGFSGGTHYPGGYQLWSSTYSSGNELVPPDP